MGDSEFITRADLERARRTLARFMFDLEQQVIASPDAETTRGAGSVWGGLNRC